MRLLLGLLAALVLAAPAEAADYDFRNLSTPVYTQSVTEELTVPTQHGTIYGWVTRPVVPEGTKVPIILTYSPYTSIEAPRPGQDGLAGPGLSAFYVPRGYARAFFHLVGTGWSGGCTDYGGVRERETAAAVVDFLGSRPWSNGEVGMIGGSYDGTTQWAAAIERPKHLSTIVPQVAISRWYDYAYGQGVRFASGSLTPLAFSYGFGQVPVVADPTKAPVAEKAVADVVPCDEVEHNVRGYEPDPVHDAFWDKRDYRALASRVKVPALIEGSWTDYNVHPINSVRMWDLVEHDKRSKLVMGLQGHNVPSFVNTAKLHHAWFDEWLLGRDTGVRDVPRVQSQLSGEGATPQDSRSFPPPFTKEVELDLGVELSGGPLTWRDDNPSLSEADVLAGRAGGAGTVLRTEPFDRAVRLAGTPVLDLTVVSSAASTHVTPVLFTESPTGQRRVFTRGLLNSRNRGGLRTSTAIVPGQPWTGFVEFQPADHLLPAGHRLGIALMSHNSREAFYGDTTFATNTVRTGGLRVEVAPAPEVE